MGQRGQKVVSLLPLMFLSEKANYRHIIEVQLPNSTRFCAQ